MNKKEMAEIMAIIKTAFPQFHKDLEKQEIEQAINLWTEVFSTDSAEIVFEAVMMYISNGKFPPTIADIRAIITDLSTPQVTAEDIWQEAYRLLNWTIGPKEEQKAYTHMTDVCRAATIAVGGWYALSMSSEDDPFIRREFIKAAEARLQSDRKRGVPFDLWKMNNLLPFNSDGILKIGGGDDG